MNNFSIEEIKNLTGLPDWKILNIYLYGSRVYGTNESDSDYDFMVLANSLDVHREVKDGKYNLHIMTPDRFQDDLWAYRMVNLECIFAPSFAKIQEKIEYSKSFGIDIYKLRRKLLSQSHDSWVKAKMKLREFDIDRGLKSAFHSLRILVFGIQMMKHGKIIDFTEANNYWEDIVNCGELDWENVKENFLPVKKDLEKTFIGKL